MSAILDIALTGLGQRKENRDLTLRRSVAFVVERYAGDGVLEEELSEVVHLHKHQILDAFRDKDAMALAAIFDRVIFNLGDRINESLEHDCQDPRSASEIDASRDGPL
jgi:hypothetical protein